MSAEHTEFPADSSDPIRRQAAEWVARRDAGFTAAEQDAFFEWLAADPRHAAAYAELQAVFRQMDVMVEWKPLHAIEPNPDLLAAPIARSGWRRATLALLATAAAVAAGFLGWSARLAPAEPRLLVASGTTRAYERHVLEDGTIVELNEGTQLSLHFEAAKRRINLISGEAHFSVAKDPRRPFVVQAAGTAVTAVGTGFNVSLQRDAVEVFVTEGRITVQPPAAPATADPAPAAELRAQSLVAGQGTVVSLEQPAAPLVVRDYPGELIERKLAWKRERLNFTETPLSEVILEFNRRNHTQLVLGDEELGRLKITGALQPTDLESFLGALAVTHQVHAERHDRSKVILRR